MTAVRRVLVGLALVVVAFPYLWVVLAAFKGPTDLNDPSKIAFTPTLANWREVVAGGIVQSALTSLTVGVITVGLSLVAGTMAAYAISR
ncbi:MAG: carbohydrate ABC transporter permease, partial [Acidimicrobiia bacterium]